MELFFEICYWNLVWRFEHIFQFGYDVLSEIDKYLFLQ